jgi:hypothetical protein
MSDDPTLFLVEIDDLLELQRMTLETLDDILSEQERTVVLMNWAEERLEADRASITWGDNGES